MVGDQVQLEQWQYQYVWQQLVIGIDQVYCQQILGQQEYCVCLLGEVEMLGDVVGKQCGGQFYQGVVFVDGGFVG